jgi:alkylation response protein AidB-like acyl-CoA dehydrogenase
MVVPGLLRAGRRLRPRSLRTRAEKREGDKYIVNGQKTWNTLGQYADWIFCLVRTDPEAKAQRGISFLLIDMKSPGITVRPIITLDGAHEVNEIWFEDVEVPIENLVGEENKGWTCAKFLLGHERSNIAGIGIAKRELARAEAHRRRRDEARQAADRGPALRRAPRRDRDRPDGAGDHQPARALRRAENKAPGPEASILKIKGTEIQQAISELMMQAVGPYALPFDGAAPGPAHAANRAAQYLNLRKLSIYGGSNEIQKNIVAQMILELCHGLLFHRRTAARSKTPSAASWPRTTPSRSAAPSASAAGWSREAWQQLADLGLLASTCRKSTAASAPARWTPCSR